MSDARPDPDRLPARPEREEPQARRGKLKIFFGASAGVGKTYAMLSDARAAKPGTAVVIGVVETHGRAETEALTAGIERLPPKEVSWRDRMLREFDLDAALARKPALILVDELAHSNVPGSRHPKRWQDVEALLDAGIDVWSTMNVEHLESLNDVVSGITGIRVWDTVPDRVFDEADEVVIVDLPPDDLLQRLKEGKVYLPQPAATAVRALFRKGNLIALRELALRRTADRVDDEMLQYRRTQAVAPVPAPDETPVTHAWRPYAMSALVCGAAALIAAPLQSVFDLSNIVMLFLLAVVLVATRYGRGPAVLAAFLSVGAFDFLYVPPRFTFSVSDAQYLLTFAVMLVVALVIGQLTAVLKFQAGVATLREERVTALYEMSRDLSGALMAEQIAEIAARFLRSEFDARAALLVAGLDGRLLPPLPLPDMPAGVDAGIAQWAYDHAEAAGHGTNTLPASAMLYLPLKAPMRMRGVLAIEPKNPARLAGPEQRRLLDTCASLLAISLERIHYVDVAQSSTLQIESERLRNSLLAAISHDLRTPLAALVGMAESLSLTDPPPAGPHARIAAAIREAAMRMSSLVDNLLDMARLQSGQVRLNRQWLPIEEVVGGALKAMGPALDTGRVRVALPAELPLLHADAVLMERVLCNLLENALKYTPPGSPIGIGAGASSSVIRLTVDDRGPGLPRGREESIFQMFERGRRESATAGVGLGLAICRAIVEAHGGTIRGESRPDGGARFTVELPRGEAPALVPAEEGRAEAGMDVE